MMRKIVFSTAFAASALTLLLFGVSNIFAGESSSSSLTAPCSGAACRDSATGVEAQANAEMDITSPDLPNFTEACRALTAIRHILIPTKTAAEYTAFLNWTQTAKGRSAVPIINCCPGYSGTACDPSPCAAQSVSSGGATVTLPATNHGGSATVACPAPGGTGSMNYSGSITGACSYGAWSVSGGCTLEAPVITSESWGLPTDRPNNQCAAPLSNTTATFYVINVPDGTSYTYTGDGGNYTGSCSGGACNFSWTPGDTGCGTYNGTETFQVCNATACTSQLFGAAVGQYCANASIGSGAQSASDCANPFNCSGSSATGSAWVPANASACSLSGLMTADGAATNVATCAGAPCTFTCTPPYVYSGGACVMPSWSAWSACTPIGGGGCDPAANQETRTCNPTGVATDCATIDGGNASKSCQPSTSGVGACAVANGTCTSTWSCSPTPVGAGSPNCAYAGHAPGFDSYTLQTNNCTCSYASTYDADGNCPPKVDCAGSWGACSVTCGGGTATYSITTNPSIGGAACPYANGATTSCNTQLCITSGGSATGGTATGGTATGGTATGGTATGGTATGGTATGGTATGGGAPTGGAPTGGAPTGGAPTGGAPTGGAPTGGAPTGGAPTGGAPTGGAPTGGAPTGGAPTGGAPTGGCFVAGTKILLVNGHKVAIQRLKIGDMLLGSNGTHNTIIKMDIMPKRDWVIYSFNGSRYFVTENHVFKTTTGWKALNPMLAQHDNHQLKIGKLSLGDVLLTLKGSVQIKRIRSKTIRHSVVYNPELDGNHEYYADGFLVHNAMKE